MKRGVGIFVFLLLGVSLFLALNNFSITGNFVKTGSNYTCYNCSDCSAALVDASPGETVYLGDSIANYTGNCIEVFSKDNVTLDCQGYNISGYNDIETAFGTTNGIYFISFSNSTIRNCNVRDFFTGFYMEASNNSVIENSDFFNNSYGATIGDGENITIRSSNFSHSPYFFIGEGQSPGTGLYVDNVNNVNVFDNFFDSNENLGIFVGSVAGANIYNNFMIGHENVWDAGTLKSVSSQEVNIFNNTLINTTGMYIQNTNSLNVSFNNITNLIDVSHGVYADVIEGVIQNNWIKNSAESGIYARDTNSGDRINISSNYIADADNGIYLVNIYYGNISIFSNELQNNNYGIRLDTAYNNSYYNNLFNSSVSNFVNFSSVVEPIFNTSLTAGENIIGGPNIGGNYWGFTNGSGFSDNCTDSDRNGICDSTYDVIAGYSTDYLPLATAPTPGIFECHNSTNCNSLISGALFGDTVILNTSINNPTSTAITFAGKDGIIFDCQNNFINGTDAVGSYGIYLPSTGDGSNNNTIQNCNVSNFMNGIYSESSNYNNYLDNAVYSNNYGFYLDNSNYSNISNLISFDSTSTDVRFAFSYYNNMEDIISISSNGGIFLAYVGYSNFTNITSNFGDGLTFNYCKNNSFDGVTAVGNDQDGINVNSYVFNNNFTNINSSFNLANGLRISTDDSNYNNIFTNSYFGFNERSGVQVQRQSISEDDRNLFDNVTITSNKEYGIQVDGNLGIR